MPKSTAKPVFYSIFLIFINNNEFQVFAKYLLVLNPTLLSIDPKTKTSIRLVKSSLVHVLSLSLLQLEDRGSRFSSTAGTAVGLTFSAQYRLAFSVELSWYKFHGEKVRRCRAYIFPVVINFPIDVSACAR